MKLPPSELISTFQKKIRFQTIIVLLLIAVIMVIVLLVKSKDPFYKGVEAGGAVVLVYMAYLIFTRRKRYAEILNPLEPEITLSKFESFLETDYSNFRKSDLRRLIVGVFLMVTMLILLFFKPHNGWTGEICVIFMGLIIISMFKSWFLMKDGMILQDLKHIIRDQPS